MTYLEPTEEQRAHVLIQSNAHERLCTNKERRELTSISDSAWWRLEHANKVPPKIKLSVKKSAWRISSLLWFIKQLENPS